MNPKVESVMKSPRRILPLALLALDTGAVLALLIHENLLEAYAALLKGAFMRKLKIGTTLANFTPLFLIPITFTVAAKTGASNVGVEGEIFSSGMAAAYVGIYCTWPPKPLLLAVCFAFAVATDTAWVWIPGFLKTYYGINEVCITILMNGMALHITSCLVSEPISADVANPQSVPVNVALPKLLKPSNANAGLFIAIVAVIAVIWVLNKITLDYKIGTVGINPTNAEYIGVNPKKMFIRTMMFSGVIGNLAGCIEVLGTYGHLLNNFVMNLKTNGILASLIVKNNVVITPLITFFLAMLRSGALSMQQNIGVPKSIADTITAIFIIMATMGLLLRFSKRRKTKVDAQ